ncbi:uncharacterized protein K452DRAFT_283538 [Aplosporella prunicola CBS 121167]|uniref:Uncharacterized protein n=1 Tax=Aplosporella prunicola CBS 121167 TaxID=1176127 RepID=A0A6A6BS15_9PEZI|nr:uncharacterized protein K452DRAFT_283538 [Aplosporella prunicola CBS 121167]KAF2146263.1 hypothetical protein K452DRAFT_283538 [Aplosporella prunicola CBS 121167]
MRGPKAPASPPSLARPPCNARDKNNSPSPRHCASKPGLASTGRPNLAPIKRPVQGEGQPSCASDDIIHQPSTFPPCPSRSLSCHSLSSTTPCPSDIRSQPVPSLSALPSLRPSFLRHSPPKPPPLSGADHPPSNG